MKVIITAENHPIVRKGLIGTFLCPNSDGAMIEFDNQAFFVHKDHFELLDRCPICGAKEETHYEDHLCRLHRDNRGICTVCRKPFQKCRYNGLVCKGNILGGCAIECAGNDFF